MESYGSHKELKGSICKAKTDNLEWRDTQTDKQTDPCIELHYVLLII